MIMRYMILTADISVYQAARGVNHAGKPLTVNGWDTTYFGQSLTHRPKQILQQLMKLYE